VDLKRPIFVIGAPRSGTSFLGKSLGALPEISYHHEPIATKTASRYVFEGLWPFEEAQAFYRQVYRWLMRIHLDGHLRFAEKTPRNCFIVPFLLHAFPDAQFIHIIRDGRDAALSLSKQPWLQSSLAGSDKWEPGGYPYGPYPRFWVEVERRKEFETTSDIHRCIWSWKRHVESALDAAMLLADDQYIELRYEDVAANPEKEAKRLIAHLGISKDDSIRKFLQAIYSADSNLIGRWKKELSKQQISEIKSEAGSLLNKLGYS